MTRNDDGEVQRLMGSCPRETYTMRDAAFQDRLERVFDVMAVACIDLRSLLCKLEVLHWVIGLTKTMVTHHQITATFAFMEGERFAKRLPQMDFFGKQRQQDLDGDDDDDDDEDDDEDDASGETDDAPAQEDPLTAPEPLRASDYREGELATRMMAVEDRMQLMTDIVFAQLFQAALDQAQRLADIWEAFGRFTRTRLRLAPEAVLDAWGKPIAAEFTAVLQWYPKVKPDEAKVNEYLGMICDGWDRWFGEED
jgi:hypothetical protein